MSLDRTDANLVATPHGPTTARERVVTLDILRGVALLGVVVANVWYWFSGIYFLQPGIRDELVSLSLDAVVFKGIGTLVSGKAISTFSFLFGLGFAMQMLRAEARGTSGAPLHRRRMAVLLLFGLAHAVFLWFGDILVGYALLGFVLLLFRRRTDRALLIWAGVFLVAIPLVMGAIPLLMSLSGREAPLPDAAAMAELRASALAAFQSGDPSRVIVQNLQMLSLFYLSPKALGMVSVLGLFLLGVLAGRRRFFEDVEGHRRAFRRVAILGLAVGLPSGLAIAVVNTRFPEDVLFSDPRLILLVTALSIIGTVPLAFGYIAAATLLVQRQEWYRRLVHVAPVGRMALANYLTQSVLCLLVFYGYGAGLIGRVGSAAALVIALVIFGIQMAWSPWWLARFHFGPAEWLWRTLTYGRLRPMRIRSTRTLPAQPPVPG